MADVDTSVVLHDERTVVSRDGTKLVAQRWAPPGAAKAEVLIVHGYADHAVRYRELAHALAEGGICTYAIDLRGHGKSDGQRGYCASFEDYLNDVDAAWQLLSHERRFIIGHSFGGLVTLDYVTRRGPHGLRGVVLSNPFLAMAMQVPKAKLLAGRIAGKLLPRLALPSGIDPNGISHDPAMVDAYRRDALVFSTATAGWFRETLVAQARVRGLSELDVPLLYLYSRADPIASGPANEALATQLQGRDKTVRECAGMFHELFNETERKGLHADVRAWILSRTNA